MKNNCLYVLRKLEKLLNILVAATCKVNTFYERESIICYISILVKNLELYMIRCVQII